ncbi:hypothetical protein ACXWTF_13015 [Thiomicrolovo sp. ZZH C-3]
MRFTGNVADLFNVNNFHTDFDRYDWARYDKVIGYAGEYDYFYIGVDGNWGASCIGSIRGVQVPESIGLHRDTFLVVMAMLDSGKPIKVTREHNDFRIVSYWIVDGKIVEAVPYSWSSCDKVPDAIVSRIRAGVSPERAMSVEQKAQYMLRICNGGIVAAINRTSGYYSMDQNQPTFLVHRALEGMLFDRAFGKLDDTKKKQLLTKLAHRAHFQEGRTKSHCLEYYYLSGDFWREHNTIKSSAGGGSVQMTIPMQAYWDSIHDTIEDIYDEQQGTLQRQENHQRQKESVMRTADLANALIKYKEIEGRTWKAKLLDNWFYGDYAKAHRPYEHLLQRLRNLNGTAILNRIKASMGREEILTVLNTLLPDAQPPRARPAN